MPAAAQPRTIACLLYADCMSLDVTGPMQVFATANDVAQHGHRRPAPYRLQLLAETPAPVKTSAGIRIVPDEAWSALALGTVDTLLVPGGDGVIAQRDNRALLDMLRRAEPLVRRLGSVCSGALLLAEAGLLDGRRATSHWSRLAQLQERHPAVQVEPDCLHTFDPGSAEDGHVFTSAGVTAGIDLALALVEADLGRPMALAVARQLVMFLRRPGGQAQFSALLAPEPRRTPRLAALLDWLPGQLGGDLSLERLATQACLPPRTLTRAFQKELGTSPARYIERLRVETASALMAQGQASVATVARLCGFGHPENLRRSFHKHYGVGPQAWAERFGSGVIDPVRSSA